MNGISHQHIHEIRKLNKATIPPTVTHASKYRHPYTPQHTRLCFKIKMKTLQLLHNSKTMSSSKVALHIQEIPFVHRTFHVQFVSTTTFTSHLQVLKTECGQKTINITFGQVHGNTGSMHYNNYHQFLH
jgi:hypothetical protein